MKTTIDFLQDAIAGHHWYYAKEYLEQPLCVHASHPRDPVVCWKADVVAFLENIPEPGYGTDSTDELAQSMVNVIERNQDADPAVVTKYIFIAEAITADSKKNIYTCATDNMGAHEELGLLEFGKNLAFGKMLGITSE